MSPRRTTAAEGDPEVIIIRSGYATDDQWLDAIAQAKATGRRVTAIAANGTAWTPEQEDW